ncbi:hypothetical protein NMG60_11036236 [Bertholletia excelsa]
MQRFLSWNRHCQIASQAIPLDEILFRHCLCGTWVQFNNIIPSPVCLNIKFVSKMSCPNASLLLGCFLLLSSFLSGILPRMHFYSFLTFIRTFYLIVTSIIFATLVDAKIHADQYFETCRPQNCGNGPNISYPFWITNQQDPNCGYSSPNFRVSCIGQSPVIQVSSYQYILEYIFYDNSSFLLARTMALDFDNTCPIPLQNFSTDGTPFQYGPSYIDLFFFYNCSKSYDDAMYQVDCASSNTTRYSFGVFHKEFLDFRNYSTGLCESWVNVPAETAPLKQLLGMHFTDVLRGGFVLQWNDSSCSKCRTSGGRCGLLTRSSPVFASMDSIPDPVLKVNILQKTYAASLIFILHIFFLSPSKLEVPKAGLSCPFINLRKFK